ncbi:TIGR00296 family protein [Candidatus Woesearchaeota archaeon]|nr:TIGR00296 family protein [Candidatus Woesearchaeota archaeon]
MVSLEEGTELIRLAKQAILSFFDKTLPEIPPASKSKFSGKAGVFVTLYKIGELRGCIGFPEAILPLYQAVIEAARAASFSDPRFPPLQKYEWEDIEVEISVLSPMQEITVERPIEYVEQITIGNDGLSVRSRKGNGLLLPQVFREYHATPRQAFEMVCEKAGLPKDAWLNTPVKLFKFQAQVFLEKDGKVIEH